MMTCNLVYSHQHFGATFDLHLVGLLYFEDGGTRFLENIVTFYQTTRWYIQIDMNMYIRALRTSSHKEIIYIYFEHHHGEFRISINTLFIYCILLCCNIEVLWL